MEGSVVAGRFLIERFAGKGGMGEVFRARDTRTGARVALKLLHAHVDGFEENERFEREARLLSELRHPAIVSYVAHGKARDGRPFLAIEWLPGRDLSQRLAEGPLSVRDCVTLLARTADALANVHRRGVVHRDIKPSNLFLRDGRVDRVTLLDFGIARLALPQSFLTHTGHIIGTPAYMAPEQARGEGELWPSTDVFSLGCVAFECLTGKPPFFAREIIAILAKILFEEVPSIEALRPATPPAFTALLARMLDKDPSRRPIDGAALRDELAALEMPLGDDTVLVPVNTPPPVSAALSGDVMQLLCIVFAIPVDEPEFAMPLTSNADGSTGRAFRDALRDRLIRLGGRVEWLADGSLAVIVPPAQSAIDQASQAARCALAVKEEWPRARVGLTTGRGVVKERLPIGDAIERAVSLLRMQGRAEPESGQIVMESGVSLDDLSAKLLEPRFEITTTEGKPVLSGERTSTTDESRPLLGRPTPCVGREQELSMLDLLWSGCVEESEARVVIVTAAPGAGKSRLRHEFLRRMEARGTPITIILGRGDLFSHGSPYGILSQSLRGFCGLAGGEPLEVQRAKLRERVSRHVPASEALRVSEFLGELCNVPFSSEDSMRLRAARSDPKLMHDQINWAFIDFVRAESAHQPLLFILEDLHWGDALTEKLVHRALGELADRPFMVLALARPEVHEIFPKLWEEHRPQLLRMRGLGKKACERLIRQVLGAALSDEQVARMIEQADGNALFLEEMIRAAADGKSDSAPETVMAMLQARLSRLDVRERHVVLAASVLGRRFVCEGVARVLGPHRSNQEIELALSFLVEKELLVARYDDPSPQSTEYTFRHALVRDAAYELLTPEDRVLGHRAVACYLEALGDADPSVIADHFQLGGDLTSAVPHYLRAAKQCCERFELSAMNRAIDRAVLAGASGEALGSLRALQCYVCYMSARHDEGIRPGMDALDLLPAGSNTWYKTLHALFSLTSQVGDTKLCGELLTLFDQVEPEPEGRGGLLEAASGVVCMFALGGARAPVERLLQRVMPIDAEIRAQYPEAHANFSIGLAIYAEHIAPDPWMHMVTSAEAASFFEKSGALREFVIVGAQQAMAEARLGATADSLATLRRVVDAAAKVKEAIPLCVSEWAQARAMLFSSEPMPMEVALEHAQAALKHGHEAPFYESHARLVLAKCLTGLERYDEAEQEARRAAEGLRGLALSRVDTLTALVHVLIAQGRTTEARACAEEGLQIIETVGSAGGLEVPMRLAVAVARRETGDIGGAREALRDTLAQIELRAEKIPDPVLRERYRNHGGENRRARELSRILSAD
ncbi:serine/threonine-protein kinase [Polyangium spumosum]|uniref:Protein kinase n=1 Tax=Polyangium spumosum TaxID=889282 RepID=A0A6N7PFZ0_9BACT|nr:serine/threonine-protein kinase [Polyangium spumosum]MRG90727.1 protein kinase [Polyangium spumosum]